MTNDEADARAYVDADRAMRAANTKRQYYWRVGKCRASDAYASNCICWHDEGTGPMAGKIDWAMVDWRDVPAPASQDAEDAARYRWLRDVGDETWTPLRERPEFSEKAIDDARAKQEHKQ